MNILHLNSNIEQSAIHLNLIESINKIKGVNGVVFYPTYKNVIKPKLPSYVTRSEILTRYDRILFNRRVTKILEELDKEFTVNKYDFVLAHSLFSNGSVASKLNKPFGVIVTNTDLHLYFEKLIYHRKKGVEILKKSSVIFFNTPYYLERIINEFIPDCLKEEIYSKSVIVPFGIDDFWLNNLNIEDDNKLLNKKVNLLYVGKINKNKNIDTLLKMNSQLNCESNGKKYQLTVIGKPTDLYGKLLVKKMQNIENLIYKKELNFQDLIKEYRSNDIFIMISHKESFGLVYAEALSQGLPVIYTEKQGFDGHFVDGEVGFSVNPVNMIDIINKINVIEANYTSFRGLSEKAKTNFKWDEIGKIFYKYIVECL